MRNAPPTVEVVDIDEPAGEGELIKVTSVSICASDMLYLKYGSTQIAGHEIAGVKADGTPVAVEAIFGCGHCKWCEQGRFHYCDSIFETALGLNAPGGMSEYFRVPERALVELPDGLHQRDACLVEPGSVAWHAVNLAAPAKDTRVAVVGAGAIGLLAAAAAAAMGVAEVAIAARHPHQIEARERIGAEAPTGDYDIVIETAGSETSLEDAVELARRGATVVTVGVFERMGWPQKASIKEVAIRHSLAYCGHHGRREFADVADMLAARPDLAEMLITQRFPLDDAPSAYEKARDRSRGVFRVVVEP